MQLPPLFLSPLFPYCGPFQSRFTLFVLLGLFLQLCPWSDSFWQHVSCAVSLLYSGSSSCCQWPVSSRIHNFPRSFPMADCSILQVDAGPCVTSSVLWQVSLSHTPWGPPKAPLEIPFLLHFPPSFLDRPHFFFSRLCLCFVGSYVIYFGFIPCQHFFLVGIYHFLYGFQEFHAFHFCSLAL